MRKADFITAVAKKTGVSKTTVENVLSGQIEVIVETLKKGEEVNITGFGSFKVSNRSARNGVNPRTGEKIQIPARKSPIFKTGKTFKESI